MRRTNSRTRLQATEGERAYEVLAVMSSAVSAHPHPVVDVNVIDSNNIIPHAYNPRYPWFGIVTSPTYTAVLAHYTKRAVVHLSTKYMRVERAAMAIYGSIW